SSHGEKSAASDLSDENREWSEMDAPASPAGVQALGDHGSRRQSDAPAIDLPKTSPADDFTDVPANAKSASDPPASERPAIPPAGTLKFDDSSVKETPGAVAGQQDSPPP